MYISVKFCECCYRKTTNMAECCICFEEIKDSVVLKCNHKFCLTCFNKWAENNETSPIDMINTGKIIKCPMCKRIYYKPINECIYLKSTNQYHYKSIICKVIFKKHYYHLIEPMEIFTFTCKNQLFKKDGIFHFNKNIFKKLNTIVKILISIYESPIGDYKEPLKLWCYKDDKNGISLKTVYNNDLIDFNNLIEAYDAFENHFQEPTILDAFIDALNSFEKIEWFDG